MAYAEVKDLVAGWRPLTPDEASRAATLLGRAAVEIDRVAPVPEGPTAQELQERLIVSCRMVQRAMAAGVGPAVTQESQTRGPFSGQVTYANPTGDVYLTKADRALLGVGGQRAGSVSMLGGG